MKTATLIKELSFKAVRSSGAGGQHVNKVSSKVVLFFNITHSEALTEDEKGLLIKGLASKLNSEQTLILNCDETRSQHKNKELVIVRFLEIIRKGLVVQKPRKRTKVPKRVVQKRLDTKKKQSDKKIHRKRPDVE